VTAFMALGVKSSVLDRKKEFERVPILRGASLERALHGGEDYELLFTLPPGKAAPPGTTRIGTIYKGSGVFFAGKPLPARGYDHFAG